MSVLMLFIDGLGLAPSSSSRLASPNLGVLQFCSDTIDDYSYAGGKAVAIDATLGVDGLPQSATGQTTLFTGVNAPQLLGSHLSAFPNAQLRDLLRRDSIFISLVETGHNVTFANAFTPAYFLRPVNRMSASSLHMLYAGLKPLWIWQIERGESLFQDFTNQMLIESDHRVNSLTPGRAGKILAGMLEHHDFALYEYFLTDASAHARIERDPDEVLQRLDEMISSLLATVDLSRDSVLLCSDHGNIEDAGTHVHTRNPVPLAAWGVHRDRILENAADLTDVKEAVCRCFFG